MSEQKTALQVEFVSTKKSKSADTTTLEFEVAFAEPHKFSVTFNDGSSFSKERVIAGKVGSATQDFLQLIGEDFYNQLLVICDRARG